MASPKALACVEVLTIGYGVVSGVVTGNSGTENEGRQRSEKQTIGNRIRNLMRLGVSRRNALLNGISSNGCWVMSKTPTINQALSNKWLVEEGLLSLAQLWSKIHHPTTVR